LSSEICPCCGLESEKLHQIQHGTVCFPCSTSACGCSGGDEKDDCNYLLYKNLKFGNHPNCNISPPRKLTVKEKQQSHQSWIEIEALEI